MSVNVYVCYKHVCVYPYVRERDTGRERGRGNLRVLDMDGGEDGHSFLSPVTLDPAGLLSPVSQVSHPYM